MIEQVRSSTPAAGDVGVRLMVGADGVRLAMVKVAVSLLLS